MVVAFNEPVRDGSDVYEFRIGSESGNLDFVLQTHVKSSSQHVDSSVFRVKITKIFVHIKCKMQMQMHAARALSICFVSFNSVNGIHCLQSVALNNEPKSKKNTHTQTLLNSLKHKCRMI